MSAQAPTPRPTATWLWSLDDDVLLEEDTAGGDLTVVTRWRETVVEGAAPQQVEALRRMRLGPVLRDNTLGGSSERGGTATTVAMTVLLDRLAGALVHSLGLPDGRPPLVSAYPDVPEPDFRPRPHAPGTRVQLSRFATLRPDDAGLVLEVPWAQYHVLLLRPEARGAVTALWQPTDAAGLALASGLPEPVAAELVSFLVAAGVVATSDDHARDDDAARQWTHHELLFSRRSRDRRGTPPSDAVMSEVTRHPPPVVRPLPRGPWFPLPTSGPDDRTDPRLSEVMDLDQTVPHVTGASVGLAALGDLLYRSARVRSTGPGVVPVADAGNAQASSQRPYHSLSSVYELELYVTAHRVDSLPPGVYHYDPRGHGLTLVDGAPDDVAAMLDAASEGAGLLDWPAVLLSVTARMARLSWLLGGAAYATALTHSGMLQQCVHLNGAAIGLATHTITAGGHHMNRILELGWPAEVGVGECIVEPDPS